MDTIPTKYWTVKVRHLNMKKAKRITPDYRLTSLRTEAAMIHSRDLAERAADYLRELYPYSVVKVERF